MLLLGLGVHCLLCWDVVGWGGVESEGALAHGSSTRRGWDRRRDVG